MHVLRFTRLVLLNALCLAVLLVATPSVQAHSLTHAQPLTCPRIIGFTPQSGTPGTSVTITGCGFTGTTTVAFHGVAASFTVNSDTQITATVPNGATTGLITVTTPTRTVKSPSKFIVPLLPPALTLSPTVGPPTSSVSVSGSNFGHYEGVDVYFDTTDEALASTNVQCLFSITISIPSEAVPGTHWITAVGRHSGPSAQASFLVQTDWTAFHNLPTHTGINPYENVLSPTNVGKLDTSWSATTGSSISSPAVANGVVYVGSGYDLYAFNAQTGGQLWSASTGNYIESSPAVANGVVYIGSFYDLQAYNGQTGTQLWSAPIGNYVSSSPTVTNGVVYVGSNDDHLYAFNAQTGVQLWSAPTGGAVTSSPAVANGVAYVGSFDDHLYAFNAQTGVQLWSAPTGNFITSSPAIANGAVYVGSGDGYLYAFNAQTGTQLWSAPSGGYSILSSPAVVNDVVYIGSGYDLDAFNAQTGTQLWSAPTGNIIESSPAVANDVVYVGSDDNHLYAFNAQMGAQLWSTLTGNFITPSPAVANGMVYVSSADGYLYAYALPPGDQLKPPARSDPASLKPNLKLPIRS